MNAKKLSKYYGDWETALTSYKTSHYVDVGVSNYWIPSKRLYMKEDYMAFEDVAFAIMRSGKGELISTEEMNRMVENDEVYIERDDDGDISFIENWVYVDLSCFGYKDYYLYTGSMRFNNFMMY